LVKLGLVTLASPPGFELSGGGFFVFGLFAAEIVPLFGLVRSQMGVGCVGFAIAAHILLALATLKVFLLGFGIGVNSPNYDMVTLFGGTILGSGSIEEGCWFDLGWCVGICDSTLS